MRALLLISPESWDSHSVSKHHYARVLARQGFHVLFVEPPDASLRKMCLTTLADEPRIRLVQGPRLAPGLRFFPSFLRRQIERRWLQRVEHLVGMHVEAVWLFENSRFYDLRFAGDRLRIYHQVDLNQVLHPARAARTADVCFCTTDLISEQLKPHNAKTYVVHHGLQQPNKIQVLSAEQIQHFKRPGPHLLYAGNLAMGYLDVELLAAVARDHHDATLHLVGGAPADAPLRKALADQPQVVWWGHQPSALLPAILAQADIMLVTYQEEHWKDQASPHKFMEYLGSGKVIVATYTHQYRNYRHLLAMADLGGDYLDLLRDVRKALPTWNSPDLVQMRRMFAQDHTYARQLERIEGILTSHGFQDFFSTP